MSQDTVLEEIRVERDCQDSLWGVEFDDQNTLNDWVVLITICVGQAARMDSSPEKQRSKLLKVAALAMAAVESFDRNGKFAPRHFESEVGMAELRELADVESGRRNCHCPCRRPVENGRPE